MQDRLDIEEDKILALQPLTTSHTSQLTSNGDILALNLKLETEKNKTVAFQSLTESHTEDITALDTLTASHTTDITALETLTASHTADILTKLDVIQDGVFSIAKTDGLQTALDSSAKLHLANTFTGLQTIVGDLKADNVLVTNTTQTLNTHLISKLYVDTALIGKQAMITNSTNLDSNSVTSSSAFVNSVDIRSGFTSSQTQVDALIEYITNVDFRAFSLSANTISSGNKLAYDIQDFDAENGYNTKTFTYTISLAGTYIFTLGVYSILRSPFAVNLIRKTGSVKTIIQQITNGTNTGNNMAYILTTITQCSIGDEVYGYVDSGFCRLNSFNLSSLNTYTSFSGTRISS